MVNLVFTSILLLWTPQCLSLTLTSSTPRISRNGTQNFHINCSTDDHHVGDQSPNRLVEIRSLRISKMESNSGRWAPLVEIDSDWEAPRLWDRNLTSSFHNGTKGPTSLKATWSVASNAAAGQYVCDVMGYTERGQGVWQRTSVFVDVEAPLSLYELLNMVKSSEKRLETAIFDINTNKENISKNKKKIHETDLDQQALSEIYYNFWPQGQYALLEPQSGCPADVGVVWKKGYVKHFTQSNNKNKDHVSEPAHMKTPIMERDPSKRNNFMTQHHCSVTEPSKGREWPTGSYCIMEYRYNTCPREFLNGYIDWHTKGEAAGASKHSWSGYFAYSYLISSHIRIRYCCRSDSSTDTPIHLPRSKPFYLFRFKGTCQQVHGMNATQEFMFFDNRRDEYNSVPDGGDGSTDHVKVELCYYEPI